jgi:uncharacterized protein (UPF0147 family)
MRLFCPVGNSVPMACPSGRPKSDQTVTELAREHGPRAIQVLAQLMNDEKVPASTRAMAADRILDRAYGKPPQLNTTDAEQFRRACDMTDDELARIASGGGPAEQPPLDPKKVN